MPRYRNTFRFFFHTAVIGIVAGLAATAFAWSIRQITALTLETFQDWPISTFFLCAIGAMFAGALVAGILMAKFCPDAAGSGIPQVKRAYLQDETKLPWSVVWVKFIGGALQIGTGSSMGREGPTVHVAAGLASRFAMLLGSSDIARSNAVAAGSAAGLAAAFNSPLSGVTFVMEEIASGRNPERYVGYALMAAALAVSVVHLIIGDFAALPSPRHLELKWGVFWLSPVVALLASLAGLAFFKPTLALRAWFKRSSIPLWLRPALGAAVAAVAASIAFGLTGNLGAFGLGELQLVGALEGDLFVRMALILLIGKLLATILCYGSGGCGGIFAPLLFLGGMCGVICGWALGDLLHMTNDDKTVFVIIGMSACLCSVVRAPITSALIVMEMTREILILPALMVAVVIAFLFNQAFCGRGFYDALLSQDGVKAHEGGMGTGERSAAI